MKANFDAYSENYRAVLAKSTGESLESASYFATQKVGHISRRMKCHPNPANILDYGCGVGMCLRPLRLAFPSAAITGSDQSRGSLEAAAREHSDCNVKVVHLEQLMTSAYEQQFDLIFVSCVFHHIEVEEHVTTLKRLRHLCSPSGQLAIFEHNPANPITRKIVNECPFDEGVSLISPRTLRHRMTKAGWQGLQLRYISFVPPKLKPFRSMERVLHWCPLGGQYFFTAQPGHGRNLVG